MYISVHIQLKGSRTKATTVGARI